MRTAIAVALSIVVAALAPAAEIEVPYEIFSLPNGLTVILHEDHTLPKVTVNTWFHVGSKDDPEQRSGFAHLFEHLMFMGTERVPGSGYDDIMEAGGGANNASTGMDRTNYYSWGPSSLLPTLLWLDADRLDGLGRAMTQEKLDLQREVVLNERRENYENQPYNKAYILIPKAVYPPDHPYHLSGIGEPEHLRAATLEDVTDFFDTFYVPSNASLVVAGSFDGEATAELIRTTFGAIPTSPSPRGLPVPIVALRGEVRLLETDRVEAARLYLVWPSPPAYGPGDAELDLVGAILADGPSSRLYRRLVIEDAVAQDVDAYQASEGLGSLFHIEATATAGGDLELIKRAIIEEVRTLQADGPDEAELERVKAAQEAAFLREMESLIRRADRLNAYRYHFGEPDSFARDLARWTSATAADVRQWARQVLTDDRLDLRILPEGEAHDTSALDTRPDGWAEVSYDPPVPVVVTLDNGIEVALVSRPGTGLFAGALLADGGARVAPPNKAGVVSLTASMVTAGAGPRNAVEYADAVASLGATVTASSSWHDLVVRVQGLSSRFEETLDLFADAVLEPRFDPDDFQRERRLALDRIRTRSQNPFTVAYLTAQALVYGPEDPRGRPASGFEATVSPLTLDDVRAIHPWLIHPSRSRLVFVGDVDPETLREALNRRLGVWTAPTTTSSSTVTPRVDAVPGIAMVDRPGAPQTVIFMLRPVPDPEDSVQVVGRRAVNTLFGGTFTSRLMRNLRERNGFTYHAGSNLGQRGRQHELYAYSAVQADATAAALSEFKKEFTRLASGDITAEEADKAISTVRYELVNTGESTASLAATLTGLASDSRPLDSVSTDLSALEVVDPGTVNRIARSGLFDWNQLRIVLVGDVESVTAQLAEAGFQAPELVDLHGQPVVPGESTADGK